MKKAARGGIVPVLRKSDVLPTMQYMKAQCLIHSKEVRADGTIVQMVVWRVPQAVPGSAHAFKYRLYCGRDGRCLVRYDNEFGKGDHRHYGETETPYGFVSLERLIEDFLNDVERVV